MAWYPPIKYDRWSLSDNPLSFNICPSSQGEIPLSPHPGSFGFKRKNHTHEGIDIYAPHGTDVFAIEAGVIVAIEAFTGPSANSPWWRDTQSLLVEGLSGVILYGEIIVSPKLSIGDKLNVQQLIGTVEQVLTKDKGRPMSMLHLELHKCGTRQSQAWEDDNKPESLLDPTSFCLHWTSCIS